MVNVVGWAVVVLLLLDELNMLLSMIYLNIEVFVEFRVLDSIDEL